MAALAATVARFIRYFMFLLIQVCGLHPMLLVLAGPAAVVVDPDWCFVCHAQSWRAANHQHQPLALNVFCMSECKKKSIKTLLSKETLQLHYL